MADEGVPCGAVPHPFRGEGVAGEAWDGGGRRRHEEDRSGSVAVEFDGAGRSGEG